MAANIFQSAIDEYLANGGAIKHIPEGVHGPRIKTRDEEIIRELDEAVASETAAASDTVGDIPDQPTADAAGDDTPVDNSDQPPARSSPKRKKSASRKTAKAEPRPAGVFSQPSQALAPASWHDDTEIKLPVGAVWLVPGAVYRMKGARA